MFRRIYHLICLILISVIFTGCMPNIKLSPTFWENRSESIAICFWPYPLEGTMLRYVSGGIFPGYTTQIDSWDTDLTAFVKTFDISEFDDVKAIFSEELTKRGMLVLPLDDEAFNSIFSKLRSENSSKEKSLNAYRKLTSADYIMIFGVPKWGVLQEGYPVLTKYYGVLVMNGILIDLRNGDIRWRNIEYKSVRVVGDWKQPPDYPNIAKAMHDAITSRKTELYESFFK
jgi:hypothetical protein